LFYSQFFSLNLKVKLFIGIITMSYTQKNLILTKKKFKDFIEGSTNACERL
jgi:hypothetical protein